MSEKLKNVQGALRELIEFLKPAIPFVNTHLNHFFTESLWETYLPEELQRDLDHISVADLKSKFKALANIKHTDNNEIKSESNLGGDVSFGQSSLDDVVHRIGQLLLASTKMSLEINNLWAYIEKGQDIICHQCEEGEESLCGGEHGNQRVEWSSWKFDPFMSQKKMHEVEIMSEFIQAVAKLRHVKSINISGTPTTDAHGGPNDREGIKFLVDVGSGKGYLSSFMTLLYDFRVLALDSSAVNTYGCTKRTETLQKNWSSFVRRARERQEEQALTKRGKHWKSKCTGGQGVNNHDDEGIKIARVVSQVETDTAVKYGTVVTDTTAPVSCTTNAAPPDMTESDNEKLKNLTLFVTENLNLSELLRETFPGSFDAPATTINANSLSSFGIIGLHTCGNLGVTSVKLFANAKNAKFIVNVPCCYHLMDEAYAPPEPGFEGSGTPGFPLSKALTQTEFYFGRNARMMSAQSVHRMSSEDEDGLNIPRPLLYRAILQVIIRQIQGPRLLENSVGRLGSKFTDFGQYVRKALNKIKLDSLEVSDEDIESTFKKYSAQSERFHKYFLLRALFAPLIEACILLDRLAYLLEQDDIQDAFIVEMFNPFLSPRCHALVAVR